MPYYTYHQFGFVDWRHGLKLTIAPLSPTTGSPMIPASQIQPTEQVA